MNSRISTFVQRLMPAPPEVVFDDWLDVDAFSLELFYMAQSGPGARRDGAIRATW